MGVIRASGESFGHGPGHSGPLPIGTKRQANNACGRIGASFPGCLRLERSVDGELHGSVAAMFPLRHPPEVCNRLRSVCSMICLKKRMHAFGWAAPRLGSPLGNQQIIELSAADLPLLRDALRLVPDGEPLFCHCRRQRLSCADDSSSWPFCPIITRTLFGWRLCRCAACRRSALHCTCLASRGIPQFLDMHKGRTACGTARKDSTGCVDRSRASSAKDKLTPLEVGPMGLPPHESSTVFDDAVGTLRSSGQTDVRLQTALPTWLGAQTVHGRIPWLRNGAARAAAATATRSSA